MIRLPLLFGILALAGTAQAETIWRGDFSTGDLSQWTGTETVGDGRLSVVADPLGSSRQVLRAIVVQGDNPINDSGNRNELFYEGDDVSSGDAERYYHWQTMWPTDYVSANTWQLFTQWHQYNGGGSPPVEFYVNGENVILTILNDGDFPQWTVPLERGKWHDFVFHVKWSTDPTVGFIELTYDGQLVIPKHYCATMLSGGGGVYLKQGLYRDAAISQNQTVYHQGMTVGTTLADVEPPAAPAPSAPTSASTPPGSASTASSETGITSSSSAGRNPLNVKAGCSQAGLGESGLVLMAAAWLMLQRRRRRAVQAKA